MSRKPQQNDTYRETVEKYTQEEPTSAAEQQARYNAMLENSKRMKKRILIILGCVLAGLLLLFLCVQVLQWVQALHASKNNAKDPNISFYPTYEGDILKNEQYLERNRLVYYCDDPYGYGVTKAITNENRSEFNAQVLFLYQYVQLIIAGDEDAYNACFSEDYFKDADPQGPFSPQMLHNIKIRYYMRESANVVTYRLDYMIYRNDGTFRRDIGSDVSRYQLITVRTDGNGEIWIDEIRNP